MAASQLRRTFARSLALAALVGVAGCGSDPTGVSIVDTRFASSLGVDLDASIRTATGLYYRDIQVGTGTTVAAMGRTASVAYSLFLSNGQHIQTGTYDFTIAPGAAIDGFVEGVIGMRAGGKRQLIIPPHLGYGAAGRGPIPGNAILVYSIELLTLN